MHGYCISIRNDLSTGICTAPGQRTASGQNAAFGFCHRLRQGYGLPNGNSQGKGHPGNQRPGILQPRPMTGQEKQSPPRHPAMGISGQTDTGRERTSDSPTDSPGTATPHKSTLGNKRLPPATVNEPQTSDSNRNHAPGTRQEKKIPKGQAPLRER